MMVFYLRAKFQVDTFTIAIVRAYSLEKKNGHLTFRGTIRETFGFPKTNFLANVDPKTCLTRVEYTEVHPCSSNSSSAQ